MPKGDFFFDIVDFTSLCERLNSQGIVEFLNAYFKNQNRVIQEHRGESDKLIGGVVNIALRIEKLTRFYRFNILVEEEIRSRLKGNHHTRFIDRVQVRGKHLPVRIYEVYDGDDESLTDQKMRNASPLQAAYELNVAARFQDALEAYRNMQNNDGPQDPTIAFYIEEERQWPDHGV